LPGSPLTAARDRRTGFAASAANPQIDADDSAQLDPGQPGNRPALHRDTSPDRTLVIRICGLCRKGGEKQMNDARMIFGALEKVGANRRNYDYGAIAVSFARDGSVVPGYAPIPGL